MATSVEAYLNEKFPSYELLKTRLEEEQTELRTEEDQTRERAETERQLILENRKNALEKLQEHLNSINPDSELVPFEGSTLSQLATDVYSDDLLSDVRATYSQFKVLASARDVVRDLKAIKEIQPTFSKTSINEVAEMIELYRTNVLPAEARLQVKSQAVHPAESLIRNMAERGLKFIDGQIYEPLLRNIQSSLRKCLADSGWPQNLPAENGPFKQLFQDALKVQKESPKSLLPGKVLNPLVAFETLVEQYDLRFRYHFEGSRETNRADKPEWIFAFVFKVIDEVTPFLSGAVQKILDGQKEFHKRRAVDEFITAFLANSIYRKLREVVPHVIQEPRLFSHLIAEMEIFDQQLRESYFYMPYGADDGTSSGGISWRGVAGDILATNNWFNVWLDAENRHANERYEEIMFSSEKWDIEFASVGEEQTKPTASALHLRYLLEGVTELYRPLSSANYQFRFLFGVQMPLVERYYRDLESHLESKEIPPGSDVIKRSVAIYSSAAYIEGALEDFSQDLLFIELYCSLGRRALDKRTSAALSSLSLSQAQQRVDDDDDDDEHSLFDGEMASLKKLKKKAMMTIGRHVGREFEHAMGGQYFRINWNVELSSSAPSAALVQPVNIAQKHLDYLKQVLSAPEFVVLQKDFASNVQRYFWKFVINANQFSMAGGQQLSRDISELWTSLGLPRDTSYYRLEQACVILCAVPSVVGPDYGQNRAVEIRQALKLNMLTDNEVDNILKRRKATVSVP